MFWTQFPFLAEDAHMTLPVKATAALWGTCMFTLASSLLFWLQGLHGGQLESQHVQCLPSLSLPWECEQACGIDSQQPIPAHIAQRQTCGTWQRCPIAACPIAAALPFKMQPRAPCPERRHLSLRHWGSLRLFLPPLADSCLSSAATFRHTFSAKQGEKPVFYVINTIVNCTLKAAPLTQLIMLQVYCAQQRKCQSCFI